MSDTLPAVSIIFLTYQRTEYALRTIRAAHAHLRYSACLQWIVADDGSDKAHLDACLEAIGWSNIHAYRSERIGYGALANWAWGQANQTGPLSLWLEDDWTCRERLDLTPYAHLLMDHEDVAMVRMAYIPINLDAHTVGYDGRMYLHIQPSQQYMFSGNPALRHQRMLDAFGPYPTGKNPGDTEIAYDAQCRDKGDRPRILWPIALGDAGAFDHIGAVKSYE